MKLFSIHWLRIGFLLWALAVPALAPLTTMAAEPPAKIKLLIIEGVSNHDWRHRLALVRKILARDGSFDVDVSITPSDPNDPA
jgi:hypothetical protein